VTVITGNEVSWATTKGEIQDQPFRLSLHVSLNNLVYPEGPRVYKWAHRQVKREIPAK
jgi:hypothetical protein